MAWELPYNMGAAIKKKKKKKKEFSIYQFHFIEKESLLTYFLQLFAMACRLLSLSDLLFFHRPLS